MMTNAELREALKREIEIPYDELIHLHPSVADFGTEFVEYTEDGRLTLAYPLNPLQRNGYKLLQGGWISAYCDNNFGIFGYVASGGSPLPTINLTINYHKSVLEDETKIWITSWVRSAGKRVVCMEAEAKDSKGRVIATCQSNMLNAGGAFISV